MSTAIPNYAKVLEHLHQPVGDRSKKDAIEWTEELKEAFKLAQDSLRTAKPLTMPQIGQQLYMSTDASQSGIGATLHRKKDKAVVKYFSKQLSAKKKCWLPCELEALAVGTGLQTFLPCFKESGCKPVIYTDSQLVVKAYEKMQRGEFSASPRVSTFLHQVLGQSAIVKHLAGSSNQPADQASRNAAQCNTPHCQVCSWIRDKESQVVNYVDIENMEPLIAGNEAIPFSDHSYWRRRQLECQDLKLLAHHLKHSTVPQKNSHKVRLKRYLQHRHGIYFRVYF